MSEKMNVRIEELSPRLTPFSFRIWGPEQDPEDHFQNMALALLEREIIWPLFVEQKDAYLVCYAAWKAKHQAFKLMTYASHVAPIEARQPQPDLEEDIMDIDDLLADESEESRSPEKMAIEDEQNDAIRTALNTLTIENRRLVGYLYLGYSQDQIARMMGISKSAVSQRKATIAKVLAAVLV